MKKLCRVFIIGGMLCSLAVQAAAQSSILDSALRGDEASMRRLIANRDMIDARDVNNRTPLLIATHRNDIGTAEALISAGADVTLADSEGARPLTHALQFNRLKSLRFY